MYLVAERLNKALSPQGLVLLPERMQLTCLPLPEPVAPSHPG